MGARETLRLALPSLKARANRARPQTPARSPSTTPAGCWRTMPARRRLTGARTRQIAVVEPWDAGMLVACRARLQPRRRREARSRRPSRSGRH